MTESSKTAPGPGAGQEPTQTVTTPVPGGAHSAASLPSSAPATVPDLAATLVHASWLGLLLGTVVQVLLLWVAAAGGRSTDFQAFLQALGGTIVWSVVLCAGLATGTASAGAMRAAWMGLAGLLAAPVGFTLARVLSATSEIPQEEPPLLLALLKTIQYGCLGAILGWEGRASRPSLPGYAAGGLLVGLLFGGTLLMILARNAPPELLPIDLWTRGLEEVLLPWGTALVLFLAEKLGRGSPG